MGVFDFVHEGAREMWIARPPLCRDRLVGVRPLARIPAYAQLTIGADDVVVVRGGDGNVVGLAGPGRHAFDAKVFPFLSSLQIQSDGGLIYEAELIFVSISERRFRAALPAFLVAEDGTALAVEAIISVTDPAALVGSLDTTLGTPISAAVEIGDVTSDAEVQVVRAIEADLADILLSAGPAALTDEAVVVRWLRARIAGHHGRCRSLGLAWDLVDHLWPAQSADGPEVVSAPARLEVPTPIGPAMGELPCRRCRKVVVASGRFCPDCGSPLGMMRWCLGCGQPLHAGARFCAWCGARSTVD